LFSRKTNDLLFEFFDEERRAFFRVRPSSKKPITISIGPNRYKVKDIGAGGMAIYRRSEDKELEREREYPFKITLPLIKEIISGAFRIVNISDRAYHCIFVNLGIEKREKIHLFVLERQKEALRAKRRS
jgi:c-di-GMP-binding flagellar brake protein YcgR